MQFLPMAGKAKSGENRILAAGDIVDLAEIQEQPEPQEVCCGGAPPPRSNPMERPGYELMPYVRGFVKDTRTDVPLVKTELDYRDHIGMLLTRLGIGRDKYKIAPGLYGVGRPHGDSPVIVTANYKLTFDGLRRELKGIDCWLLVLDTCGINVWCAAGKKTFSTDEIVRQVDGCNLADKVNHRKLVVPQLGATGVAAHEVKLKCGFRVVYGPIRACDLKEFLQNAMKATPDMRAVTFTLKERFELIPVEFYLFGKKIWWFFPIFFILSGIGPAVFSFTQAWQRGLLGSFAIVIGGMSGAMIVPLLLPLIPGRSFSLKGALAGVLIALLLVLQVPGLLFDKVAIVLIMTAVSSYLAMNFTGSTPYTSPSGVEKEMRRAIPLQGLALVMGAILWLAGPFI